MISLRDIKGQDSAVKYLAGSLSSGRIAASYLFYGPGGVGRAMCAKAFIMALICPDKPRTDEPCLKCPGCRRVDTLSHPDVAWIKPEKNKAIKIEQIRGARDVLNLKPYESNVNVCVIEDAHMMTVEASNALLKVLEEPPGHSILILITDRKELMLETVVSRCAEVRFRYLSIGDTRDIVTKVNREIDGKSAYFLAYFSQGSPGKALSMADGGAEERKNELVALLGSVAKENAPICMSWDTESKDGILDDLEMIIMFFRDITMEKTGMRDKVLDRNIVDTEMFRCFKTYSIDKIYEITEQLINTKLALSGNVNPKLVSQALPGIIRGELELSG
ncbi:MAG: DNA polymerase III subunit delta' [Candidatus Omnitrophota bacterium]